jgi:2-iminobutanoate/2-iminopropanoate deaminase
MKKIVRTDQAPQALGPYNQAIVDYDTGLVYTAGQIGIDPKFGELVSPDVRDQAHQVFHNLKAVLNAAGSGFDHVLKSTIFLKNIDDFDAVNEIYAEHFVKDFPARSTVEVARLPKGALVEIEFIARLPTKARGPET